MQRPWNRISTALVACLSLSLSAFVNSPASAEESEYAKLLDACKINLAAAIDAAEKKVNGKAIMASLETDENDKPVFEVTVLSNDKAALVDVEVDAVGTVFASSANEDEDLANHFKKLLAKAKHSLVDLIAKAEAKHPGRTFNAELELDGDKVVATIELLTSEKPREVELRVDGASGEILEVVDEDSAEEGMR